MLLLRIFFFPLNFPLIYLETVHRTSTFDNRDLLWATLVVDGGKGCQLANIQVPQDWVRHNFNVLDLLLNFVLFKFSEKLINIKELCVFECY